MQQNHTDLFSN